MRKEKSFPSIGARARVAGEPTRLLDPRRNRTVNARRIRSLLPSVGAIANDPRFPPKAAAIDGNAIRDWTHRIWFHGRCTAPSYSCVEIVKISRGYPPLNWIAATCALPTTRQPYPLLRFVSACYPARFSFRLAARVRARFFSTFFSLPFVFLHGTTTTAERRTRWFRYVRQFRLFLGQILQTGDFDSRKRKEMCVFVCFSLSLSRSNYSNGFVSRLDNHGTGYSAFFKSVGRFQSWLARVSFENFVNLYDWAGRARR